MQQNLVGYSGVSVRKVPRALFERWSMLLRIWKKTKEERLLELIEADVKENWNEELEAQFRAIHEMD